MSIKPDTWISEMSKNNKMIEPFSENQVRVDEKGNKLISYGIPIGGELEYVDGNTIARAIQGRTEINVD
jgi:recombinational DNA repair protein RecR